MSLLTFAVTLHNGIMLSSGLEQTLAMIINQILGVILPKGLDGTPLDINAVLGKAVHEIIADTMGEAKAASLTAESKNG